MSHSTMSTKLLLSLGTVPLLIALVASKALADFMIDFGQATEEIFRGDRLPILHISSNSEE